MELDAVADPDYLFTDGSGLPWKDNITAVVEQMPLADSKRHFSYNNAKRAEMALFYLGPANSGLNQIRALFVCLSLFSQSLTITHNHSLTLTISCTCCCDEIKGVQDLKIYSHADSLILSSFWVVYVSVLCVSLFFCFCLPFHCRCVPFLLLSFDLFSVCVSFHLLSLSLSFGSLCACSFLSLFVRLLSVPTGFVDLICFHDLLTVCSLRQSRE